MKKSNILAKSLILFTFCVLFFAQQVQAYPTWSNSGGGAWLYRKQVTVSNSGTSALNNYQVYVTTGSIGAGTLKSLGKLQSDYDDLRFADFNNKELSYWIDPSTSAATGFWIKVSTVNSSGNTLIYAYYGNSYAVSASSGTKTFIFFDDFNDNSINSSKWTSVSGGGGSVNETNGEMRISGDGSNITYLRSQSSYSAPYVLDMDAKKSENIIITIHWDGAIQGIYDQLQNGYYAPKYNSWDTPKKFELQEWTGGSGASLGTYVITLDTNYHDYKTSAKTDGIIVYYDGTQVISTTDTTKTSGYIGLTSRETPSAVNSYYDNLRIRKYASPEPTIAQVGNEEETSPPNAPMSPKCEGVTNPTNVSDFTPDFTWTFSDPDTGDTQGAFRVLVSTSKTNLTANTGEKWDSGKYTATWSSTTYAGSALTSHTTYYWKVMTWDNKDLLGVYCSSQSFVMGMVKNAPNAPANPKCTGLTNPANVADYTPDFTWTFSDPDTGDTQGAFRVLVSTSKTNLTANTGEKWDSGKLSIALSSATYAGSGLLESTTYYWKVMTWDNNDLLGVYCSSQSFVIGTFPTGWLYNTPLYIYNSGTAQNDYQVFISTKDAGTTTLRSQGKMLSNYNDLRFTDVNRKKLNYWIDPSTSAATGFWIRVSTVIATGNTTLYMYYGNSYAVSASSGTKTFIFFDDFNDNSINSSKWTKVLQNTGEDIFERNNRIEVVNDGDRAYLRSLITYSAPYILEVRASRTSINDNSNIEVVVHWDGNKETMYEMILNGYYAPSYDGWTNPTQGPLELVRYSAGSPVGMVSYTMNPELDANWHSYKTVVKTSGIDVYYDGGNILNSTNTTRTSGYIGLSAREQAGVNAYYDNFRVRKYAATEPTIGSEQTSAPNAPTTPQCTGLTNPANVADYTPDFTWTFSDPDTGDTQGAFRVLVSTSKTNLTANTGEKWDSGKYTATWSSTTYAGSALTSHTTYYWKVMTWDNKDLLGVYCSSQSFIMGNRAPNNPQSPKCENQTNPANVSNFTPKFQWIFSDPDTGDTQTAYRILVSTSQTNLNANTGEKWNTGYTYSSSSYTVYAGSALNGHSTYYWKVQNWDNHNSTSSYCSNQSIVTVNRSANAPTTPQCTGLTNPANVADFTPDFTWTFSDPDTGDTQGAFRVLVSTSKANLTADTGEKWDSGKYTATWSSTTYAGSALNSHTTYYWKVMTWDNKDLLGVYCSSQSFVMGNRAPNNPQSPECENQTNPANVSNITPKFQWIFSDPDTGDTQTAYRILVSTSQTNLNANTGEKWDSTKISVSYSSGTYAGSALSEKSTYYWVVMTWDNHESSGNYSSIQSFVMADLNSKPVLTSISAAQTAGNVDLNYSASDKEQSSVSISAWYFNGTSSMTCAGLSGDYGAGISTGTGKQLIWNAKNDFNGHYMTNMYMKIKADDLQGGTTVQNTSTFTLDTKDPVVSSAVRIDNAPLLSGVTYFTLNSVWTEDSAQTPYFDYNLNGSGYVGWSAGSAGNNSIKKYAVTLNGDDYFTAIKSTYTDTYGNKALSEDTATVYVCPLVPQNPAVESPSRTTLNVTINPNAGETAAAWYIIKATSSAGGTQYVQATGQLGGSKAWRTAAAWDSPVTVQGLNNGTTYWFSVCAGNPNDGTPTTGENSASGYTESVKGETNINMAPNVLNISASQNSGTGNVNIGYTASDIEDSSVTITLSYWDGEAYQSCSSLSGNYGSGISTGSAKSAVWNAKAYYNSQYKTDVLIRINANDLQGGVTNWYSVAFNLDTKDPVVSSAVRIDNAPLLSGVTYFTLNSVWTEDSAQTPYFDYNLNGSGYVGWSAGSAGNNSIKKYAVTLNGDDYFTAIKSTYTDTYGNKALSEDTATVYVCPLVPQNPAISNETTTTLDITINPNAGETAAVWYVIKATSTVGGTQYVQATGQLGGSKAWRTAAAWDSPVTVQGLNSGTTYWFSVCAGNPNDGTPTTGENSASGYTESVKGVTLPVRATKVIASANPLSINANGVSTSVITAYLCFSDDSVVTTATNQVTFSVVGDGALLGTTLTNASIGSATVMLRSTATAGTATVTATANNMTEGTVSVTTVTPVPSRISVSLSKSYILANMIDTVNITATVYDSDNEAVSSTQTVRFKAYCGLTERSESGAYSSTHTAVTSGGNATFVYRDLMAGEFVIKAAVNAYSIEGSTTVLCIVDSLNNGDTTAVSSDDDGKTKVNISSGTFATNTMIVVNSIESNDPRIISTTLEGGAELQNNTLREFNAYELLFSNWVKISSATFQKPVEIIIPYNGSSYSGLQEDYLRIFTYNEDSDVWIMLAENVQTINKIDNCVSATVEHFSIYALGLITFPEEVLLYQNYPNPVYTLSDTGGTTIEYNLPNPVEYTLSLKVYTISGQLVKEFASPDGFEQTRTGPCRWSVVWNMKNELSQDVASGIYLCLLTSQESGGGALSKKTIKIAVLKRSR